MHGKGQFKHADGHELNGYFANNLFELNQDSQKYFVDPFNSQSEHQVHIQKIKSSQVFKKKEEETYNERVRVYRANNIGELKDQLY